MFHAQAKPEISVRDYLIRINKYGNFSNSVSVAAMVYIDRILERHPEIVLTSRTVHRLLIAAMLLAAKFNDVQFFERIGDKRDRLFLQCLWETDVLEKKNKGI